jgi:uncharacterized LabA/DUF88 family protein
MVYIDFENISELLRKYGHNPLKMNFFEVIQDKLITSELKIIDIIVFNNFEKDLANVKLQTLLRSLGLRTNQASNNGKNSADLELMVSALKDLYKNPNIDVFVIISSDRDIIPLLKAIKYENKLTYLISTQNGFNPIVAKHTDFHEYIEDIFKLPALSEIIENQDGLLKLTEVDPGAVDPNKLQRAEEVAGYFYKSDIRVRAQYIGKPVNLKGYFDVITKVIKRSPADILDDFKLAHRLKYITIYRDPERGLCLKVGEQIGRIVN